MCRPYLVLLIHHYWKKAQYLCLNEGGVRELTGRLYAPSVVALIQHFFVFYLASTAKMKDKKIFSKLDCNLKHRSKSWETHGAAKRFALSDGTGQLLSYQTGAATRKPS